MGRKVEGAVDGAESVVRQTVRVHQVAEFVTQLGKLVFERKKKKLGKHIDS